MTGERASAGAVRAVAALLVAVLVACASPPGDPGTAAPDEPDDPTSGEPAPPGATTSAPPATDPPEDVPAPPAPAPGGTAPAAPGEPGSTPTTVADPGLVPAGQMAPFVLRPDTGSRIVVEVRTQAGAEPARATLERVVGVLGEVSGKQVVLDGPSGLDPGPSHWTEDDLRSAADGAATATQGDGQAVLRLLFVSGELAERPSVLGTAVRGDVAAVFGERVRRSAGLLVSPTVIEEAVTVHELGHLLGLVDLVLDTGRADPDHPGHSPNRESVMYWQVASDTITALLGGGIPRHFDADDLADLATIRGS